MKPIPPSLIFKLPPNPSIPIFLPRHFTKQLDHQQPKQTSPKVHNYVPSPHRFPVHQIYCIGRNYADHAIEMGHNPDREPPFFFTKPARTSLVDTHSQPAVPFPKQTQNLHFEGELVIAIGKNSERGKVISTKDAQDYVYGYGLGCDLTRRDLQSEAKELRRPWDAAKGFECSAPVGPIVPLSEFSFGGAEAREEDLTLFLEVNGAVRQKSSIRKMIWNIHEVISELSKLFSLREGDLVFTGTPANVGKLHSGDEVKVTCGDLPPCEFRIE